MNIKKVKIMVVRLCIVFFALLLIFPAINFAGTVQLSQTGQFNCYDENGNQIACAGTGQDGDVQAGFVWPSPRFHDNDNGTVTDKLTGLMWPVHGNLPGGTTTWQQALDYVANMNSSSGTYGYTDWRLPNINELESIVNADVNNSAIWLNGQAFVNLQPYHYWSSTTVVDSLDRAWIIEMGYGHVATIVKTTSNGYVLPVRAGQRGSIDPNYPANIWMTGQKISYATGDDGDLQRGVEFPSPRFIDHDFGTVTDNLTGLMWAKNANLPNGATTWQQALDFIATINNGSGTFGYSDWRLPNRKELKSLFDYSRYNPALPQVHPFTNVQSSCYWSSTTFADIPTFAWIDDMWNGLVGIGTKSNPDSIYYLGYVWPVRGGQGVPTAINLSSFTATPKAGKVILQWSTETETGNAGFNLYRATAEDGVYIKINSALIAAEGSSAQGTRYEFIDSGLMNAEPYYYKLEDVDLNGKNTMHEVVKATPRWIYGVGK
jgi:hypothetical protein